MEFDGNITFQANIWSVYACFDADAVPMIRVEICPDITLSSKITLTFPLIMYSKYVRSNLF